MRQPAARTKPRTAKIATFPAPVSGWIANQNLQTPGARMPDGSSVMGASMLENWFPIATGIRMRGGSETFATVGEGDETVTSLFVYMNGNNQKLFAATETSLYDITQGFADNILVTQTSEELVDDEGNFLIAIAETLPALLDGFTGGEWSVVQFATPGGVFLRAVNGEDTPYVYDGTTWATTPAITGVDPTTLSYVFVFKRRLFFIKKDSLNAYYLPVDSIGGAAVELPLGGVFNRGGSLLFGSSWSLDGGGGLTEQCIFVTTEGEVAVYQGDDPSVAASWSLVGVYRIGKPLGPRAWIRAGGDLGIATNIGLIPLSQAVQRDYAALSPSAISYRVETKWNEAVAQRQNENWHCEVWPSKQMVVVALPTTTDTSPQVFVANARTGAWALFTGWDARCVQLFGDRLFFGSTNGKVIEAEKTGADRGEVYTANYVPLFDPLKTSASLKTGMSARATLMSPLKVLPKLSLQSDFTIKLPPPPDDIVKPAGSVWGVGIWGTSLWGSVAQRKTFQEWRSVNGSGYALAPSVQVSSGSISAPEVELVSVDLTYDLADIVT